MNETQIEHWNGPGARHWIDGQDRYERQPAPFAVELLRIDISAPMLVAGGGSLDETLEFLLATGIARAMLEDAEPDAAARAVAATRGALTSHHDGEGVRLAAATWVVTARSRT